MARGRRLEVGGFGAMSGIKVYGSDGSPLDGRERNEEIQRIAGLLVSEVAARRSEDEVAA